MAGLFPILISREGYLVHMDSFGNITWHLESIFLQLYMSNILDFIKSSLDLVTN